MADLSVNIFSAEFTVNGQHSNQKIALGAAVTLQVVDTQATTYCWEVFSSPPGCPYQLIGEYQSQATFTAHDTGTYIVQLSVSKDGRQAVARRLLWIITGQQKYRLPATREPLRFTGDEEWAGDLIQVVKDVEDNLPSPVQKAALEAASNPGQNNPFATKNDLPTPELTAEQKAALDAANKPGQTNPFATRNDLPRPELTSDQKAALDSARNPRAANPLATMADIPAIRTVAAGSVDLSRVSPPTTPGRIGVIASDPSRGLATLSFVNFDGSRRDAYIVKALPINVRAGRQHGDREGHGNKEDDDDRREIVVVQLVEFAPGGFTLHMVELPNRKPALGPCLVEVSEIG